MDHEATSTPGGAVCCDGSAVGGDEFCGHRQPDAGAARGGGGAPEEAVEHPWEFVGGDAGPGVGDL